VNKIIIIIFVYVTLTTYITRDVFKANDYIAEFMPLLFGYLYLIVVLKGVKLNLITLSVGIYISILTIITLYSIIVTGDNILRLIFIYSYLPALWLTSYNKLIANDAEFILRALTYMGAISAVVGISQYLNIQQLIPIDFNRARGLSRSTLNYSSLMMLSYIAADNTSSKIKGRLKLLLFLGAVCSLGRGAVISIVIYEVIKNAYEKRKFIAYMVTLGIVILIMYGINLSNNLPTKIDLMLKKYLYSLDFVNDPGNAERLSYYLRIFDNITIAGNGFGSTGPAAARFSSLATGFESFTLALFYHGGLIFIVISLLIIIMLFKIKIISNKNIFIAIASAYGAMMTAQQTFETPSVNIMAWIILLAIIHKSCMRPKLKISTNGLPTVSPPK
jgi:hypothetical protein